MWNHSYLASIEIQKMQFSIQLAAKIFGSVLRRTPGAEILQLNVKVKKVKVKNNNGDNRGQKQRKEFTFVLI